MRAFSHLPSLTLNHLAEATPSSFSQHRLWPRLDLQPGPALPYLQRHPLSHPGGGPKSTWYAVPPGPGGRGRGLIDASFSEAFVRERGEGEAIVRA
jgi:hypothetical protein